MGFDKALEKIVWELLGRQDKPCKILYENPEIVQRSILVLQILVSWNLLNDLLLFFGECKKKKKT